MLGMQMLSPTVNMFIEGENFVKLAQNPYKYIHDLEPFPVEENYIEREIKPHPVIGIGDIRLNCLHYANCEQTIDDSIIMLDRSIWSRNMLGEIEPSLTGFYRHGVKRNFEKVFDFVRWINDTFDHEEFKNK